MKQAYEDVAFQIGAGQTISQPYTVAFQSELLNIKKGDKVVTIGGIHGRISGTEGDAVIIEVDKGIKIKMEKKLSSMNPCICSTTARYFNVFF